MKKIGKSSELLWVFGVVFVALGVAVCSKTDLGVSMIAAPAFVVHQFLAPSLGWLSVGIAEYVIQGLMLALLCAVIRRFNWRYLLAFAVAVVYGYTLDLFLLILGDVSFDSAATRWIMLFVGDIITAFGVACFFHTYMPLQVYELFVAELAARFGFNINKTKWSFDASLLAISVTLALTLFGDADSLTLSSLGSSSFHSIGLGTLVTTAINSPVIALSGRLIERVFDPSPRFKRMEAALKRK